MKEFLVWGVEMHKNRAVVEQVWKGIFLWLRAALIRELITQVMESLQRILHSLATWANGQKFAQTVWDVARGGADLSTLAFSLSGDLLLWIVIGVLIAIPFLANANSSVLSLPAGVGVGVLLVRVEVGP